MYCKILWFVNVICPQTMGCKFVHIPEILHCFPDLAFKYHFMCVSVEDTCVVNLTFLTFVIKNSC